MFYKMKFRNALVCKYFKSLEKGVRDSIAGKMGTISCKKEGRESAELPLYDRNDGPKNVKKRVVYF